MHITCQVILPQDAVPPLGIVHDADTRITIVALYHARDQSWEPLSAITGGYPARRAPLPECFTLDRRIVAVLNKKVAPVVARRGQEAGENLLEDLITEDSP